MTDTHLICAELRAGDLLTALQHALMGTPGWRLEAARLLRSISDHELPEPTIAALREADARKRAAEILTDVCQADVY